MAARVVLGRALSYCLIESDGSDTCSIETTNTLPLQSFNHISREVLDEEVSGRFYKNILGFREIDRPDFEADGMWLYGYGLCLHLIRTRFEEKRIMLKGRRLEHFETALPTVDHIAFTSNNLSYIENTLKNSHTFYRKFQSDEIGVEQIFIFDPDGNVIEVSNCGVPIGAKKCSWKEVETMPEIAENTLRRARSCGQLSVHR